MAGGALAGALADMSGTAACVSAGFVAAAVPALVAYRAWGAGSLALNLALMAAAGLAVNGPYALITTAVSADLGSHRSLAGAPCHLVFPQATLAQARDVSLAQTGTHCWPHTND